MSDPQVVNTLRAKAENIQGYIAKLERDIEQARADLSHVVAAIHLFEAPDAGTHHPMLYNLDRLFKRQEIGKLCHEALASGPLDTRQLAEWIIVKKGFPTPDRHLRTSVALRIVQALRYAGEARRQDRTHRQEGWRDCVAAPRLKLIVIGGTTLTFFSFDRRNLPNIMIGP